MKIDKLGTFSYALPTGGNLTHNTGKGKINGLLFQCSEDDRDRLTTVRITVKLRHETGVEVLVNRLTAYELMEISNINGGFVGSSSNVQVLRSIVPKLLATSTIDQTIHDLYMSSLGREEAGFYVDLGHLTLGDAELDISFEANPDPTNPPARNADIHFYTYYNNPSPDIYRVYDESFDTEQRHRFVRQVFAMAQNMNTDNGMQNFDLHYQIDGDRSYIFDIKSALLQTNLFSKIESSGQKNCALLYGEYSELPADIYIKATGQNIKDVKFVYIKEKLVPSKVSKSTVSNAEEMVKRIERLERDYPEMAKAYRHAGKINKSQEVKEAVEVVKEKNEEDKKSL